MQNKLKVVSGKLEVYENIETELQLQFCAREIENLELSVDLLGDNQNNAIKLSQVQEKLAFLTAIKENLLAIRNIEASGQTLADKEREEGVTFDQIKGVFKAFVEDVWLMRRAQKDPNPAAAQRENYEREVDESLAILVGHRPDVPANEVLGQEGEDNQLNN
jgi:hypothetical protein